MVFIIFITRLPLLFSISESFIMQCIFLCFIFPSVAIVQLSLYFCVYIYPFYIVSASILCHVYLSLVQSTLDVQCTSMSLSCSVYIPCIAYTSCVLYVPILYYVVCIFLVQPQLNSVHLLYIFFFVSLVLLLSFLVSFTGGVSI